MEAKLELVGSEDIKRFREKGLKSKGRMCCRCESYDTRINSSGIPIWFRYTDESGNWDGESYLCHKCWMYDYYYKIKKVDPNSTNNIIKSMSGYKIGIGKYTNNGIGLIGEAVIAKVKKIKIYCTVHDNFNVKFDLLDTEQGRIQSKLRSPIWGNWSTRVWSARIDRIHNFDILYFLCADERPKNIKRVYVILEEYIHDIRTVGIPENPKYGYSKYDKFRLSREEETIYNDVFCGLMSYLKKDKFTINDIIKWLEME